MAKLSAFVQTSKQHNGASSNGLNESMKRSLSPSSYKSADLDEEEYESGAEVDNDESEHANDDNANEENQQLAASQQPFNLPHAMSFLQNHKPFNTFDYSHLLSQAKLAAAATAPNPLLSFAPPPHHHSNAHLASLGTNNTNDMQHFYHNYVLFSNLFNQRMATKPNGILPHTDFNNNNNSNNQLGSSNEPHYGAPSNKKRKSDNFRGNNY